MDDDLFEQIKADVGEQMRANLADLASAAFRRPPIGAPAYADPDTGDRIHVITTLGAHR